MLQRSLDKESGYLLVSLLVQWNKTECHDLQEVKPTYQGDRFPPPGFVRGFHRATILQKGWWQSGSFAPRIHFPPSSLWTVRSTSEQAATV